MTLYDLALILIAIVLLALVVIPTAQPIPDYSSESIDTRAQEE